MENQFQQKIFVLNQKLTQIQKPQSTIQKLSQCRNQFLKLKQNTEQKLKQFKTSIKKLEYQIQTKSSKIDKQKKVIDNFSNQKYEQLIEIVQQWVQQFDNTLAKAKQQLKISEVTADQKICEYQRQAQVFGCTYQQKINKNLKTITKQLDNYQKMCQQQSQYIKKSFVNFKKAYQSAINDHQKNLLLMQKAIKHKLEKTNQKLGVKAQELFEKWRVKDSKTKRIFQTLVQML